MIRFILNNKLITTDINNGTTLLDFIRYEHHLTGTKIGCREGDCAACGILVGTLEENGTVSYQSMTSCITPLGGVHNKHIVTIEGTNLVNKLNVAQIAMRDNYATQCGFCSPGFVVSLVGFALSNEEKNEENALDAIGGNICRCTGYQSIKKAAVSVCEKLHKRDNQKAIKWLIDKNFIPSYFADIAARLQSLQTSSNGVSNGIKVSGGTDLYVQRPDELAMNQISILTNNPTLKGIRIDGNKCIVGANSTVTDMWNHTELNSYYPNLRTLLKLVSSQPIRNMASIGGNIVNASPIGDMTAMFLAWDSTLIIKNSNGAERELPLKKFYKGYKQYDLKNEEIIKAIYFNLPARTTLFNFEKVCKRTHLDIASVNSAVQMRIVGNKIVHIGLSIGGVSPIPLYLTETIRFLTDNEISWPILHKANEILQKEISPISDVRGSIEYKRLLARQLFFAHFTTLFPNGINIRGYKLIA